MIEDKELGLKIAENTDEVFWTEKKEELIKAVSSNKRDAIILQNMLQLCEEQLKLFV